MAHAPTAAAATVAAPADRPPGQGTERRMQGSPNGTSRADIDGAHFRSVLGRFATGVVAITAIDPATAGPTGLAANSFTSVSLEPPLVAFCVAHTSTTWPRLRGAGRICINILGEPQLDICKRLALKGGDKFAGIGWTESPSGSPVIDGALAWLDCEIENTHVAGDHAIVVARVHHLDQHHDGAPLLFYRGGYGRFSG